MSVILKIDRSTPFNPAEYINDGFRIEEEDERSLNLTEVDVDDIRLETSLRENESAIGGDERLRRLKEANYVRLDAGVRGAIWNNKHLIPESWKQRSNHGYSTTHIFFDGTIVCDRYGRRYVLCICWDNDQWNLCYKCLQVDFYASCPSAILTRVPT